MTLDPAPMPAATARAARSALVSAVVVGCATSAHVAAGGAVGAEAVAGLAAVSTLVTLVLMGRRSPTGQLLGLLLLGQAGLHLLGTRAARTTPRPSARSVASVPATPGGRPVWPAVQGRAPRGVA